MIRKRLESFTIIELLMVMLISSILIALVFVGIQQMTILERSFQHNSDRTLNWKEFESVIQRDAFYAEHIILGEESIKFENDEKEIVYEMRDSVIIRNGIKKKIYPLPLLAAKGTFINEPLDNGLCDKLILNFEKKSIYLEKKYSAQQLMNFEQ